MIHIDEEKWFLFLTEENLRFCRTTKEKDDNNSAPKTVCTHKSQILKVMLLAAVARPRFDDKGEECTFDGKIGIWPFFIEKVPAKRLSNRRAKGTIETKPVSVKKENYLEMIIEGIAGNLLQMARYGKLVDRTMNTAYPTRQRSFALQRCSFILAGGK
jgi:hypothetical protein